MTLILTEAPVISGQQITDQTVQFGLVSLLSEFVHFRFDLIKHLWNQTSPVTSFHLILR